jgi:hypothetical protein
MGLQMMFGFEDRTTAVTSYSLRTGMFTFLVFTYVGVRVTIKLTVHTFVISLASMPFNMQLFVFDVTESFIADFTCVTWQVMY